MATKEELEEQLERARADIETLARMAGQTAQQKAQSAVRGAEQVMDHLSDDARALYESALQEGAKLRQASEDTIKSNPLASIGIAFVAGMLLSGLMRR